MKDKHIKFFSPCHIMRNLQKNLNIIWQPLISRHPPPPFCFTPSPFLAKIFRPSSISINFEKIEPLFMKGVGGGVRTVQLFVAIFVVCQIYVFSIILIIPKTKEACLSLFTFECNAKSFAIAFIIFVLFGRPVGVSKADW